MATSRKFVRTDAGRWIDMVVGDYQGFSSSNFSILSEVGSKLFSLTMNFKTHSYSEFLESPSLCINSC